MGKLPKNPVAGKTYTVTINAKNGKRKVKALATGKTGFGKWKFISNKKIKSAPKKKKA